MYVQQLEEKRGRVIPDSKNQMPCSFFAKFPQLLESLELVHKGKILSGEDMLQEERKGVDILLAWGQKCKGSGI